MTFPLALLLDLIGTFVFALSGGLLAVRRDFDIVGIAVLALAAGLGGGVLRDVLLGVTPPAALRDEVYLATALAAALVSFLCHPRVERLAASVRLLDALGLGFFAVSGTLRSLDTGLDVVPAVLLGVVTGAGGGVIRDLLAREIPMVLRRDVYALAALLGAAAFVATTQLGLARTPASIVGITATFTLRLLALRYGWQAPRPRHRGSGASANVNDG